jgi:hypothetical protein
MITYYSTKMKSEAFPPLCKRLSQPPLEHYFASELLAAVCEHLAMHILTKYRIRQQNFGTQEVFATGNIQRQTVLTGETLHNIEEVVHCKHNNCFTARFLW